MDAKKAKKSAEEASIGVIAGARQNPAESQKKATAESDLQQDINFILKSDLGETKRAGKSAESALPTTINNAPTQEFAKNKIEQSAEGNAQQALIASLTSNPGLMALLNNETVKNFM